MFEIGAKLKEQRIAKGLSIEDVQNATKIRSWYIEAIELGELERLPGKFYEKAFIKTYAELVELDPAFYNEYLAESEPISVSKQLEKADNYRPESSAILTIRSLLKKPLLYVLLLLVVVVFYIVITIFADNNDKDPNQFNNKPSGQEQEEPKGEIPGNGAGNLPSTDKVIINKLDQTTLNNEFYQIVSDSKEVYLDFEIAGPCWVSIKENNINGTEIFVGTLNTQTAFEKIKLDRPLYMHIGNAQNINILVNDEKIDLGDLKVVKRVTLELGE
jgi:hypothetical protein